MNKKTIIIAFTAAVLALASCTKQSLKTAYNNQEDKIDKYITSLTDKDPALRVVHSNGSHKVISVEGTGEELTKSGSVAFYYAGYTFNGSISANNLFATNHQETAEAAKWTVDTEIKTVNMSKPDLIDGLYEGLAGVREGEECMILFSGEFGFGKKPLGTVPANSALAFHIWVVSVNND